VGIDLDGRKNNFVKSNQFTVSGRLVTQIPTSLTVRRATCWVDPGPAGQDYIDVFVTSNPSASVTLSGPSVVDPVSGLPVDLPLLTDGNGNFYIHAYSDETQIPPPSGNPYPITLTASLAGAATTSVTYNVTDVVSVGAIYSVGSKTLTVQATSTDGVSPTLTLKGYETIIPVIDATGARTWTIGAGAMLVPPPTVTVISTMGGTDTDSVFIVP
jgi:hypothetical protein